MKYDLDPACSFLQAEKVDKMSSSTSSGTIKGWMSEAQVLDLLKGDRDLWE